MTGEEKHNSCRILIQTKQLIYLRYHEWRLEGTQERYNKFSSARLHAPYAIEKMRFLADN